MEEPQAKQVNKAISRKLLENAIEDAQYLVAYATGKCERDIDNETLATLIAARQCLDENRPLDPKAEAKFWLAYQRIWTLVKPATAESVKANLPIERNFAGRFLDNTRFLSRWVEIRNTSRARRTVNWYIFFTVLVLFSVLLLQIYWVVGNQLTTHLAELLAKETELSAQINENRQELSAIEIRFKQAEMDLESFRTNGVYTFYYSPEWERDTLENLSERARLETEMESLKSQLTRSSAFLLVWSRPWLEENIQPEDIANTGQYASQISSIDRQISEIADQLQKDPNGSGRIQEAKDQIANIQRQLVELEKTPDANSDQTLILRSSMQSLTDWVNQPGLADLIISQLNSDMERLKADKEALIRQQKGDLNREISRQAQLAGEFVLVILQSYLLPLLYGILGAVTSVLRSLSKQIEGVVYSEQAGIQHLLLISLGALAGIMVGWFSFLLPGESATFVGSISPLAIAFLVGYNIELFFSMMDIALNRVNEMRRRSAAPAAQESQPPASQKGITPPDTTTAATVESPPVGEPVG